MSTAQAAPDSPLSLSTARLIAAPAAVDGIWTMGVAITLKPKAITYWRDPGEAGVPPRFDFSASTNVARADVSYPVPRHIHEGEIDAIGYEGEVVFPVRITPAKANARSIVRLQLDYAVCEHICLPARADLTLDLPPPPAAVDAGRIAAATAAVPRILDTAAARDVVDVLPQKEGDKISWLVRPKARGPETRLFVEAPDGFFLDTKHEDNGFRVSVAEHPAGRSVPDSLRLTIVQPGGAVEVTVHGG